MLSLTWCIWCRLTAKGWCLPPDIWRSAGGRWTRGALEPGVAKLRKHQNSFDTSKSQWLVDLFGILLGTKNILQGVMARACNRLKIYFPPVFHNWIGACESAAGRGLQNHSLKCLRTLKRCHLVPPTANQFSPKETPQNKNTLKKCSASKSSNRKFQINCAKRQLPLTLAYSSGRSIMPKAAAQLACLHKAATPSLGLAKVSYTWATVYRCFPSFSFNTKIIEENMKIRRIESSSLFMLYWNW